MRWFLTRLRGNVWSALPTRKAAIYYRDKVAHVWPELNVPTVEVIPARAIREMIVEWDAMAKKSQFENGPLTDGEIAMIKAMRQDLQERLGSL